MDGYYIYSLHICIVMNVMITRKYFYQYYTQFQFYFFKYIKKKLEHFLNNLQCFYTKKSSCSFSISPTHLVNCSFSLSPNSQTKF